MGLPWVRLDTQFASNPKILALLAEKKFRASFAYVASLGYSGAHGTDGFLPDLCLAFIHATRADARALVDVGLWNEHPGGWEINGWTEFQQSSDEAAQRKQRAKDAARKRWEKTG
ncbi:hypothetical protein [Rhodococcus sp. BE178]|uniref:hypothetical protein n=1 Tax=Rhodococcus sp. BE178 TaxID=2817737 RepID=UPI003D200C53